MADPISQIKQQLDISDVIGSYIPIIKAGRNYKANCPFHSEDTPSFMISPELQIFKCFGCGESGDMFTFVRKLENIEFPAALEILAERAGVKLEKFEYDLGEKEKKQIFAINDVASTFYHNVLLRHSEGLAGLNYLTKQRGLTADTIKEFKLGFAPNRYDVLYKYLNSKGYSKDLMLKAGLVIDTSSGPRDKFMGRVMFPFIDVGGKTVGFSGRTIFDKDPKYLNTSETPVFHKSSFLYGLNNSKLVIKKSGAIFVEGPVDVISAYQAGIQNVVASSGTSLTEGQLKLIGRYTKDIKFCFDSDSAGSTAMQRAIKLAEKFDFNIRAIIVPEEFKDLDDVVRQNAERAKSLVLNSVSVFDFFVAAAFKKFDKNTPEGKRAILNELKEMFADLKSDVLLDHYAREISSDLNLRYEIVYEAFLHKNHAKEDTNEDNLEPDISKDPFHSFGQFTLEHYVLSLLLKSEIDKIREFAYKLDAEDFVDLNTKAVFINLIKFIEQDGIDSFSIVRFKEFLPSEYQNFAEDLYLLDYNTGDNADQILPDLLIRIKQATLKHSLMQLGADIKMAERSGDTEKLEKLTKKFNKLSKQLIKK